MGIFYYIANNFLYENNLKNQTHRHSKFLIKMRTKKNKIRNFDSLLQNTKLSRKGLAFSVQQEG